MFKTVADRVWAFDLEWVPDPVTGRLVYDLPETMPDAKVAREMQLRAGATEEEPQVYLKTILCRVVSIAAVVRRVLVAGDARVDLVSLPRRGEEAATERELLSRFFGAFSRDQRPQLVGFNSAGCDLPILVQRAVALGLSAPEFCKRPDRPWEGVDYFGRHSDWHVDLKDVVGGWGRAMPSLHEIAQASGIPGKIDLAGHDVADLWSAGEVRRIVEYNEFDALTTYLLWLRVAHFAGHFSSPQYRAEQERVQELLSTRYAGGEAHLGRYLDRWRSLRHRRETGEPPASHLLQDNCSPQPEASDEGQR